MVFVGPLGTYLPEDWKIKKEIKHQYVERSTKGAWFFFFFWGEEYRLTLFKHTYSLCTCDLQRDTNTFFFSICQCVNTLEITKEKRKTATCVCRCTDLIATIGTQVLNLLFIYFLFFYPCMSHPCNPCSSSTFNTYFFFYTCYSILFFVILFLSINEWMNSSIYTRTLWYIPLFTWLLFNKKIIYKSLAYFLWPNE